MNKLVVIILILLISLQFKSKENFDEIDLYQKLRINWNKMFPDGNRNAAGAIFFK